MKTIKKLMVSIKQVEAGKLKIAKERDKMRVIYEEIAELLESFDSGIELLDEGVRSISDAIDSISEVV